MFGSTINQNNCLYIEVSTVGSESALAQIVKLVQSAQMTKAYAIDRLMSINLYLFQ